MGGTSIYEGTRASIVATALKLVLVVQNLVGLKQNRVADQPSNASEVSLDGIFGRDRRTNSFRGREGRRPINP
jgi:hypothetical protein